VEAEAPEPPASATPVAPLPPEAAKAPEPAPTPVHAAPRNPAPARVVAAKPKPVAENAAPRKVAPPAPARPSQRPATRLAALSSQTSVAPASAATPASSAAVADYRSSIFARISAHTHYPDAALPRDARGIATVKFALGNAGEVISVALARSAGDPALDADAPATVRRAGPFGPPPQGAPRDYVVPIRYEPH
jgi:TonB family protein